MLKKLLIISTLLILSSCTSPKGWGIAFKPHPMSGMANFPSPDTDYGHGFKDGCEGSLLAISRGATDFLEARIDPVLAVKNPDYSRGWYDGHEQCVFIMDHDVL